MSTRGRRYKGVRQRQWGSWVSEIRHSISKARVWLGTFDTAKEAAKAYDEAARLMEGPRAKTNFPSSASLSSISASSLLSPSVRAKLQRCNCMPTSLQGASKAAIAATASSKLVNATKEASDESSTLVRAPLIPYERAQKGPTAFLTGANIKQQSLVCLRLDDSQDQLGVTWQASTDSKPQWVTMLHVLAGSCLVNTPPNQASLSSATHNHGLMEFNRAPIISHEGPISQRYQVRDQREQSIIQSNCSSYSTMETAFSNNAAESQYADSSPDCNAVCGPSNPSTTYSDALALSADLWYLAQDDLLAAAASYGNDASLSVLCDQLRAYPCYSEICHELYGQQLWQ